MLLVVDANVLFSALLRDGLTRRVLFKSPNSFLAPEFIAFEYAKHRDYLAQKYAGSIQDLDKLASVILSRIRLIPNESLTPFILGALSLTQDKNDALYLACALKEDASIWSNDKGFYKQKRVKVFSTLDLSIT